ncbi:hypothetical protein [Streptomyces sp. NPDC006477]|uniref:hypothetical protein n=1 Tax=Streptomyces sp. NPDC006477 TaxID=3364747 RepID=UPI00368879E8
MNEENQSQEEEHSHRWSLLKDKEFYELGDMISRYLEGVNGAGDCPHVDSPLVDSIETMAYVIYNASPLPNDPVARQIVMRMLEHIGLVAFNAGVRFERDGNRLDTENFMDGEIRPQHETMKWDEDRAKALRDWRENMRSQFYRPEESGMPAALRRLLEGLLGESISPGDQLMVANPEMIQKLKDAGVQVPHQKSNDDSSGTGLYL